jgi:hypothetical protein
VAYTSAGPFSIYDRLRAENSNLQNIPWGTSLVGVAEDILKAELPCPKNLLTYQCYLLGPRIYALYNQYSSSPAINSASQVIRHEISPPSSRPSLLCSRENTWISRGRQFVTKNGLRQTGLVVYAL